MTDEAGAAEPLGDQLARVETMAALARFAGGVAHDLNNLLTTINGYADLALAALAGLAGTAAHDDIGEVRRAGERTAALSRDLLVIGQRHTAPQGSVEVDAVLADWLDALREKTGTARLETSFRSSGSKIAITPAALVRVVDNLVENAAEAIAEGGSDAGRSIGVSTRLVSAPVETSIDAIVPAGMWQPSSSPTTVAG